MSPTASWSLGLIGLLLLTLFCWRLHGPRIEADLRGRTSETLAAAGFGDADAALDGRDVTLTGTVASEADRARAVAAARGTRGVRTVIDRLTVAAGGGTSAGADGRLAGFALAPDGAGWVARGVVASEAARTALMARLRAAFPGRTIRDGLTVRADADASGWQAALAALLPTLGPVDGPDLRLDGGAVVLRGTVPSAAVQAEVEAAARAALPAGWRLQSALVVAGAAAPDTAASFAADQVERSGSTDAGVQSAEAALRDALSIGSVEFESGTATLTPRSREILDRAAAVFARFPAVGAEVQGHTDSQGDDASNERLSQQRAQAVRDYLAGRGTDRAALTPRGYGEAEPIADNATADGRARNRRVVFRLQTR